MITVCDVGPRDGLQNEPDVLPPETRAELIRRLADAGVPRVEAVSFVRDDRVPQMAEAERVAELAAGVPAELSGLVLNERGWERFRATGLARVNVTVAATDSFSERNAGMPRAEALRQTVAILEAADVPSTATISVAFGDPFVGSVDEGEVVEVAGRLAEAGAGELVLADTIGVATPRAVRRLTERVAALGRSTGGHFHNTRNTGYANALAALDAGATMLDASVGGLGGCPFAPRATGNIATEDLVYLLEGEGFATGIDLSALADISLWIAGVLGRDLPGQLARAGIPRPS
ncbi:MAG TPA: hydroxymethylglutaryl-CoA lyase [Gaiellaceae bacterium]|nr:hydroxymethylglutaryl-CoA lyase [Gaiellaceae bacterium]